MEAALWYVLTGTRGGTNRVRILNALDEQPRNANQLAESLELDYKTIRHHLDVLLENGLVLYYYLIDPTLSAWWHDESLVPMIVWQTQMAINVAQTAGLSFLLWITLD